MVGSPHPRGGWRRGAAGRVSLWVGRPRVGGPATPGALWPPDTAPAGPRGRGQRHSELWCSSRHGGSRRGPRNLEAAASRCAHRRPAAGAPRPRGAGAPRPRGAGAPRPRGTAAPRPRGTAAPRPRGTAAAVGPGQPARDSQAQAEWGLVQPTEPPFSTPGSPPLLGTQCGLYPSLAQSSELGGGFPVERPGSWRSSCPV